MKTKTSVGFFGVLAVGSLTAGAQLIDFQSLNFHTVNGVNYTNYVASGAAVLGSSNDVAFNEFAGDNNGTNADTLSNVHYADGTAATGVSISAAFERDFTGDGSSDGNLNPALFDYALGSSPYDGSGPDTLDFSGLAPDTSFNLVLYSNNKSGSRGFLLTGGGADAILNDDIATTYTSNLDAAATALNGVTTYDGNYIEVQVTSDAQGKVNLTLQDANQFDANGAPDEYELDLAGGQLQQILSVPEPSGNALMAIGAGLLALFGYRWRAKQSTIL